MRITLCSSIFIKHKIYLNMYNVYSCYINYNRNRITSSINVDQSFAVGALASGGAQPASFILGTWFRLGMGILVLSGISGVGDADHRSGLPLSHVYLHVTLQHWQIYYKCLTYISSSITIQHIHIINDYYLVNTYTVWTYIFKCMKYYK